MIHHQHDIEHSSGAIRKPGNLHPTVISNVHRVNTYIDQNSYYEMLSDFFVEKYDIKF